MQNTGFNNKITYLLIALTGVTAVLIGCIVWQRSFHKAPAVVNTPTTATINIPSNPVRRLCIYYGYPSAVNSAGGNIPKAVLEFSSCDEVIFGNGLETASHPEHAGTKAIIESLHSQDSSKKVYGYINLGCTSRYPTVLDLENQVDAWVLMKADGIFYDCVSDYYGVSKELLSVAASTAHIRGLSIFYNSDHLEWLLDQRVVLPEDQILIEPLFQSEGQPFNSKYTDAYISELIKTTGVKLAGVATLNPASSVDKLNEQYNALMIKAWDVGLSSMAFSDSNYSASGRNANVLYIPEN